MSKKVSFNLLKKQLPNTDKVAAPAILSALGMAIALIDPTMISSKLIANDKLQTLLAEGLKMGLPEFVSSYIDGYQKRAEAEKNHSNLKLFSRSVLKLMNEASEKVYLKLLDHPRCSDLFDKKESKSIFTDFTKELTQEAYVEELFNNNGHLEPVVFIEKAIKDHLDLNKIFNAPNSESKISLKEKKEIDEVIVETFKTSFIDRFKIELNDDDVARVSYHTHLLHSLEVWQKKLATSKELKELFENAISQLKNDIITQLSSIKSDTQRLPFIEKGLKDIKSSIDSLNSKVTEQSLPNQLNTIITQKPKTYKDLRSIATKLFEENFDNHSHFHKKYIEPIYHVRKGAHEKFDRFKTQTKKKCFVITGKAGRGKTSLFCKLASSSTGIYDNGLSLLLNCPDLKLNKNTLIKKIEASFEGSSLHEISDILKNEADLKTEDTKGNEPPKLVVFFDAINELDRDDDFDVFEVFGQQLNELIQLTKSNNYPFLFCVSCRSDFWNFFYDHDWVLKDTFEPTLSQNPSYELGDYPEDEIDDIIKKHFDWFRLKGEPKGKARIQCQDPLMLRYLCEAYTNRDNDDRVKPPSLIDVVKVKSPEILQKKRVFDTFVTNIRKRMINRLNRNLKSKNLSEKKIANYTTNYLISLCELMFKQKRAYITLDEAMAVAKQIDHFDAKLSKNDFDSSDKSIFYMFIDEGLILDKEEEEGKYNFVFESYFEYTLGRYIALKRWGKFLNKPNTEDLIKQDLESLLDLDNQLKEKQQPFTNLVGAIQYAILVTEDDKKYEDSPLLFLDLIQTILHSKHASFIHLQKAFATLRISSLLAGFVKKADKKKSDYLIRQALSRLRNFAKKSEDFVILWDLENTLEKMAKLEPEIVTSSMQDWSEENNNRILQIFSTQVLARLSKIELGTSIKVIKNLSVQAEYKKSFWLSRNLIFAVSEIIKDSELVLSEKQLKGIWKILNTLIAEKEASIYSKDLAFSTLPYLVKGNQKYAEKILDYIHSASISFWGIWNLIFELKEWHKYGDVSTNSWIWDVLEKALELDNAQLDYIVNETLLSIKLTREHSRYLNLLEKIPVISWSKEKVNTKGGEILDKHKCDKTGLVYTPFYLETSYDNHTECRQRIQAVLNKLTQLGDTYYNWVLPINPSRAQLEAVHGKRKENDYHSDGTLWENYLVEVKQASNSLKKGEKRKQVGPAELRYESFEIAKLSAGGVISAIDYIMKNEANSAWSLGRPPGHLANNAICILNNIAIGAKYALKEYKETIERVLIIDCDAHHGKHTAKVFSEDDKVIYLSIHIEGSHAKDGGFPEHIGINKGVGYNFNLMYPSYTTDEAYNYIATKFIEPLALEYKPDLIMISAGFDGHFDDELNPGGAFSEKAYISLSESIFRVMSKLKIKTVGAVEGGYGLEGLANSITHMMNIIGDWKIDQNEIGFIKNNKKEDTEKLKEVKKMLKKRVLSMKDCKIKNSNYKLFNDEKTWKHLLS
ncbi:histone deacetylase [uncultured Winogradskyella sp.]|uniref:histone deacetylase family protein n=1 Tax=uncultured Winogradskyella sp. TaxID=395353 RepID=UPI0026373C31|nr:histone deacetylase [uncultured Winogradskyella sp.]